MDEEKKNKIHLTEEELAQYVEAFVNDKLMEIPLRLREHISICDACAAEALNMIEIIRKDYIDKIIRNSGI